MSPCNVTFIGEVDIATDDLCNYANYHAIMFVVFGIMLVISLVMTALLYVCNGCTVTDSVERCAKITVLYLFLAFGLESVLVFAYVVMAVLFVCVPVRDVLAGCFPRRVAGVVPIPIPPPVVEVAAIIIETAPPPEFIDIVVEFPAYEEESSTECTICLDLIGSSPLLETNCGHKFHLACIVKWSNNTCPNCRAPLDL
jgi:hypothetical protein